MNTSRKAIEWLICPCIDILPAFDKEQDSLYFLDFVNKRYPNINFTLNYHISATLHTISKINFRNFAKSFVKKMLALS